MRPVALLLPALIACLPAASAESGGLGGQADTVAERAPFDPAKWELVWSDEFDRPGAPDPAKWNPEEGYLRNREAQYYTRDRAENARVEDGRLIIEARRDDWQGKPITSASLTTKERQPFLYGRLVVRAKVPTGRGTWPAIWLLGEDVRQVGWPACGEIDVMEYVGFDPHKVHANIHCTAYNHMKHNGKGSKIELTSPWTQFHDYAIEWHEDRIEFFCDDTRYFVYRKAGDDVASWPFAKPHFLILNLAIGGGWGGVKGIDDTLFPHRFEIDYVRYYQPRKTP